MMMQFDVDLILMIIWNWIKKKWGKSFYISSLSALPPNFFSLQSTQFLPNWNKKKSPQAKSSWAQLVCRSKNLHFPKAFKKSSWHFRRLMSKKKSPLKKAGKRNSGAKHEKLFGWEDNKSWIKAPIHLLLLLITT